MPKNSRIVRHRRGSATNGNLPQEWKDITRELRAIPITKKYISKVELAAFKIKGERVPRWLVDTSNTEYSTRTEALEVAKKLTWMMLLSRGAPPIPDNLRDLLICDKTTDCRLFSGHEERCRTTGDYFVGVTLCQLCKAVINFEDFDRDATKDSRGIQIGHHIPLSKGVRGHNERNVAWAHRSCNQMQSEQTLDEVLRNMAIILEGHGYTVSGSNRP